MPLWLIILLLALMRVSLSLRMEKSEFSCVQRLAAAHFVSQSESVVQLGIVRANSSIFACVSGFTAQEARNTEHSVVIISRLPLRVWLMLVTHVLLVSPKNIDVAEAIVFAS